MKLRDVLDVCVDTQQRLSRSHNSHSIHLHVKTLTQTTSRQEGRSEVRVKNQQACIIKSNLRPDLVYCKIGVGSQIMAIKIIAHVLMILVFW